MVLVATSPVNVGTSGEWMVTVVDADLKTHLIYIILAGAVLQVNVPFNTMKIIMNIIDLMFIVKML